MTKELYSWGSMPPETYIRDRVDDQINWYSKKSASNKRWYHTLQIIVLITTALIPIISVASGDIKARIAVAIIGLVTAVTTGILSLYQFKDQWIDYRSTAEMLKFEKILFLAKAEPYTDKSSFSLFVTRVETILMQENKGWRSRFFSVEDQAANALSQTHADTLQSP